MDEKQFAQEVIKSANLGESARHVVNNGNHCIKVNYGSNGNNTTCYFTIIKTNSGFKLHNRVAYNNRNSYDSENANALGVYLNRTIIPIANKIKQNTSEKNSTDNSKVQDKIRNRNLENQELQNQSASGQQNVLQKQSVQKVVNKTPVQSQQPWNWTWDGDDEIEIGNLKFTGLKGLQQNDSQTEQLKAALGGLGYDTNNLSGSLKQYLQNKKNSQSYTSSLKPESKPIEDYYDDRLRGGLQNLYSYISGNQNRGATWRLGKKDYNDIINSDWYNQLDDNSKQYFTRDKLNNQLGDRYFRSYLIGMNNNNQ